MLKIDPVRKIVRIISVDYDARDPLIGPIGGREVQVEAPAIEAAWYDDVYNNNGDWVLSQLLYLFTSPNLH